MVYSQAKLKSDGNKAYFFQTILNTKYISEIVTYVDRTEGFS
jgi:hypothetical protein